MICQMKLLLLVCKEKKRITEKLLKNNRQMEKT